MHVFKFDNSQNSFQQVVVCFPFLFFPCLFTHERTHSCTCTHTHTHMQISTLMCFTELDEHLQKGVGILTSYINELRTFMIKFPWKPADAPDDCGINKDVLTVKEGKIWEKLSFEVNMSTHHISADSDSLRKHQKKWILESVPMQWSLWPGS